MSRQPDVAICFHLGYVSRFNEFVPFIDNVIKCCKKHDLFITYREDVDISNVRQKYPKAHIIRTSHGCDTGAFLLQIKYLLTTKRSYDYILKIHTKSNNPIFKNWKDELLQPIVGSRNKINHVFKCFENDHKVGMIGSHKWLLTRDINDSCFQDVCNRYKIDKNGHFIGGTIFWIRGIIIYKMFHSVDLDKEYNLCELGKPSEPSYTHTWERVYGLIVSTMGCKIKGI